DRLEARLELLLEGPLAEHPHAELVAVLLPDGGDDVRALRGVGVRRGALRTHALVDDPVRSGDRDLVPRLDRLPGLGLEDPGEAVALHRAAEQLAHGLRLLAAEAVDDHGRLGGLRVLRIARVLVRRR